MVQFVPGEELVERWVAFYEVAHAHPELAHAEHRTTEMVEAELDRLGVEHFRVSSTGTVAVIRNGEGPTVAFRADVDGLPVTEETGLPYASRDVAEQGGEGVGLMHACGHDTHFTALLGALEHLLSVREQWAGTLVLVFQPAEETGSGADAMLAGGLWDRAPRPDVVLAQHVGPLPSGMYVTKPRDMMSLGDTLAVTVRGRQAHGSQPESSVDPVVVAAAMVLRLQTIASREVSPRAGVVVTVGTIRGGTAPNIIPDTCSFTINVRTPDAATRETVMEAVDRILRAEAAASRASVEHETISSFPRCFNDPEQTDKVRAALVDAYGEQAVMVLDHGVTASEDAGALADAIDVPLVYWMFGGFEPSAFDGGMPAGNHSPHFAPHGPSAVRTGIAGAVVAVLGYVGG